MNNTLATITTPKPVQDSKLGNQERNFNYKYKFYSKTENKRSEIFKGKQRLQNSIDSTDSV